LLPANRSCTYSRNKGFGISLAGFGRINARSACHCAVWARYSRPPPRVAAFRRNSREIVDGDRQSCLAISRTPSPRATASAICSRSAKDRYRTVGAAADGKIGRGHTAALSESASSDGLGHTGDRGCALAGMPLRNSLPERPSLGAMQNRRPTWRPQLGPQRSIRSQLLLLHQHLRLGCVATTG
jgi:hypothetical protein